MRRSLAVGFTGTSRGMTPEQSRTLFHVLSLVNGEWFHHGACIGADAEAHAIATDLGYMTALHPGDNPEVRVRLKADAINSARPMLERNRDIVAAADVLVAAPHQEEEVRRSGTWATIRYARAAHLPFVLIAPSGRLI